MRILFCCPTPINPRLGASKVYLEVAEGFRRLGWETVLIGPEHLGATGRSLENRFALRDYVRTHAARFDVVEYEHDQLPFPRTDFPASTLLVARSVFLAHVHAAIPIPSLPTIRAKVGKLIKGRQRRRYLQKCVQHADETAANADFINVANTDDREFLLKAGHRSEKIGVFPYGLFPKRRAQFAPRAEDLPPSPVVAFVGTFDPRKGMVEFPWIVGAVAARHPTVDFRLIGTAGMVPTAEQVRSYFPTRDRARLQVIPHFEPAELPTLLADCSMGVFPSHCEGFGFGVLEMLAAGLPVVAYRAPGPPMMLSPEFLAPRGDWRALADTVAGLLADSSKLVAARIWAAKRALEFDWELILNQTADRYQAELLRLRSSSL